MIKRIFISVFLLLTFSSSFVFSQEEGGSGRFPPQAILAASYMGNARLVTDILEAGVDVDTRNGFGDTALHVAVFQMNIEVVKLLLDYGFDPNAISARTGYTPLHNAVSAGNIDAARLLLQYGANKNIRGLDGLTPFEKARKEGKRDLQSLLYR